MSDLRSLAAHASHYLIGRAGIMLMAFLSFPVLTRILSINQYGAMSLALKLCLLWTVLSKCGVQNAALRFYPEESAKGADGKRACASTLILLSISLALLMAAIGALLSAGGLIALPQVATALAPLLLLLAVMRSVQPTLSGLLRSERRTWLFNLCELSGKSLGIVFSVGALLLFSIDLHFYVAGLVLAEGLVVLCILAWFCRSGALSLRSVDLRLGVKAFLFSAPLVAYEITSVLLDSGDRLLIGHYLGLEQLGLYSAAYAIATYAEEGLMTPVNMALMPMYMKIWVERGELATSRFLSRVLEGFVMACGAIAVLVFSCSQPLISLLASRKFAAANTLLPVLVCGLLVYAVHIVFNAPLLIHKRSMVLTGATTVSCLFNVALNLTLLPLMGIMGAAVATLASYILLVTVLALASRRYLHIAIPFRAAITAALLTGSIAVPLGKCSVGSAWGDLVTKAPLALLLYVAGLSVSVPEARRMFGSLLRLNSGQMAFGRVGEE